MAVKKVFKNSGQRQSKNCKKLLIYRPNSHWFLHISLGENLTKIIFSYRPLQAGVLKYNMVISGAKIAGVNLDYAQTPLPTNSSNAQNLPPKHTLPIPISFDYSET